MPQNVCFLGTCWYQKGLQTQQKTASRTRCEKVTKITPKMVPKLSEMASQMHPGSSKMMPERLTIIGGTHFEDPWASKVTPWVPKVAPGVPKVNPQVPPGLKKEPIWVLKATPGTLLALMLASFSLPWLAILLPAAPSPLRPTDPSTLRPNNPSTLLRYRKGPAECAERLNPPPTACSGKSVLNI